MNMTRDCPSPGDSATDLSGLDRTDQDAADVTSDDVLDEQWPPPDGDDAEPPAIFPSAPDAPTAGRRVPRGKATLHGQPLVVILLASYASAVTIALIYVVLSGVFGRRHELESLPDIPPLDAAAFQYAPPHAALPPGHRLEIGEARRFGHVLVEPLRVTTGVVDFVHFTGHSDQSPPASVPALKLWVRLTNLSEDQLIAPLDRTLVFKRDYLEETGQLLANNFVTSRSTASPDAPRLFLLDHPLTSEWNLTEQQLGVRLKPGESVETYLPAQTEGLADLARDLTWRMHLRKGYHAPSGHGVTTLVEVAFNKDDIEPETDGHSASG